MLRKKSPAERVNEEALNAYAQTELGLRGEVRLLKPWTEKAYDNTFLWKVGTPRGSITTYRRLDPPYEVVRHDVRLHREDSEEMVLKALRHELRHAEQSERMGRDAFNARGRLDVAEDTENTPDSYCERSLERDANQVMEDEWRNLRRVLR